MAIEGKGPQCRTGLNSKQARTSGNLLARRQEAGCGEGWIEND